MVRSDRLIHFIDNYDSFSFNIIQYVEAQGYQCQVFKNDQISATELLKLNPRKIILSPGPGRPEDAGIALELVRTAPNDLPIFGICLGLQVIAQAFGADVVRAVQPMHGKTSPVYHDSLGVFASLPSPIDCTRYHSLIVDENSLDLDQLYVTAYSQSLPFSEREIMGLRHVTRPLFGVQFHPEAILSQYGPDLIGNFLRMT